MAITFVQSASALGVGNVPVAFPVNNTAGNCIVLACAAYTAGGMTLNDSQNNSYSTVVPFFNDLGTLQGQLFFAFNIKAGPNTVTFSPGAAAGSMASIHEFSGVDTLDGLAAANGVGNLQDSTAATTNHAKELLFGFTMASVTTGLTIVNDPAYTLAESHIDALSTVVSFLTQWKIVSALGNYNSTSTTTVSKSGAVHWGAEIETFFSSITPPATKTFVSGFGV
jgi:hypothetical protein